MYCMMGRDLCGPTTGNNDFNLKGIIMHTVRMFAICVQEVV